MAANEQTTDSSVLPRPAETPRCLWPEGWTDEKEAALEAKQLRAAQRLCERLSQVPFYAERAKNNPHYWYDLAASAINV